MLIDYFKKTLLKRKIPDFLIERLPNGVHDTLYKAIEELTDLEVSSKIFEILKETFLKTATQIGLKRWEFFYLKKPNLLTLNQWKSLIYLLNKTSAEGPTINNIMSILKIFDSTAYLYNINLLPLYAVSSSFVPEKEYVILSESSSFKVLTKDSNEYLIEEFLILNNPIFFYETSPLDIMDMNLRIFLENLIRLVIPANVYIKFNYKKVIYSLLTFTSEGKLFDINLNDFTTKEFVLHPYIYEDIKKANFKIQDCIAVNKDIRILKIGRKVWLFNYSNFFVKQIANDIRQMFFLRKKNLLYLNTIDNKILVYNIFKDSLQTLSYTFYLICPLINEEGFYVRDSSFNYYTILFEKNQTQKVVNVLEVPNFLSKIQMFDLSKGYMFDILQNRLVFYNIVSDSNYEINFLDLQHYTFITDCMIDLKNIVLILKNNLNNTIGLHNIKFKASTIPEPILTLNTSYNKIYFSNFNYCKDLILINDYEKQGLIVWNFVSDNVDTSRFIIPLQNFVSYAIL